MATRQDSERQSFERQSSERSALPPPDSRWTEQKLDTGRDYPLRRPPLDAPEGGTSRLSARNIRVSKR